jgi:hypothetical protein
MPTKKIEDVNGMLDLVEETANKSNSKVKFEDVLEAIGHRSFGPLILLIGLIIVAPVVGDIPGVPTSAGILVLLVCVQFLLGRTHFWFPRWMRERSMKATSVRKMTKKMRGVARFIDRFLRPRLQWFVTGAALQVIAVLSVFLALVMPLMEIVPFSANVAGAVLTFFGLALIGKDGAFAIVAHVLALATIGVMAVGLT